MSVLQHWLNPMARKPFVDHTTASFCFIMENFKSVQECASMNLKPSAPRAAFTTEEHSAASNSTADPYCEVYFISSKIFKNISVFFITEKWRTVPRRVKLWSLLFCIDFFFLRQGFTMKPMMVSNFFFKFIFNFIYYYCMYVFMVNWVYGTCRNQKTVLWSQVSPSIFM